MRERKNENFNKLSDDIKMLAYTEVDLSEDQKRSLKLKYCKDDSLYTFIKKNNIPEQTHYMVYSPLMMILDKSCNGFITSEYPLGSFLPGDAGDWTDDDESFILLYNKNFETFYVLNYETKDVLYEGKISYIGKISDIRYRNSYFYTYGIFNIDDIVIDDVLNSIHNDMKFAVCAIVNHYYRKGRNNV